MSNFPIIAATIGDIGGIGPEVCLKAAASEKLTRVYYPLLIGSRRGAGSCSALRLSIWHQATKEDASIPHGVLTRLEQFSWI